MVSKNKLIVADALFTNSNFFYLPALTVFSIYECTVMLPLCTSNVGLFSVYHIIRRAKELEIPQL